MFDNFYEGKRVLVTGHTGFKGSWLSAWLIKLGAQVTGVSKDIPTNPSMFVEIGLENRLEHRIQDIRSLPGLLPIFEEVRPELVFHMAAQPIVSKSYIDPVETISSNVLGTTHVLEALRLADYPCSAVIITSDKCYDNVEWPWGYRENDRLGGKDIYSGSKGAAELVCKSYYHSFFKNSAIRIATARAGNVIGGGDWALDRIVPDCMRAWSEGRAVEIRSPRATRPWQHVLEPLSGYLALARALVENDNLNGESFNFGPRSEHNHTVGEIIRDMVDSWDFDDPAAAYNSTEERTFSEAGLLKLNCDKALHDLSWQQALDYPQMIEMIGAWYFVFYREHRQMLDYTFDQIDYYVQMARVNEIPWAGTAG